MIFVTMFRRVALFGGCVAIALAFVAAGRATKAADGNISFNRDIRPILSDNCFQCHGPDEQKRKAGLRLDRKEFAFQPAESGDVAIVPGKPDASPLVRRIVSDDADQKMPPADSGKKLTPRQIDLLRRWIAEGARRQAQRRRW